jgi:hypothetical protein
MKKFYLIVSLISLLVSCSDNPTVPDFHDGLTDRIEFYKTGWDSVARHSKSIVTDTFKRSDVVVYKRVVLKEHLNEGDRIFIAGLRENGDTNSSETIMIRSNDERHYFEFNYGVWTNRDSCYRFGGYYFRGGKQVFFSDRKVYILN